MNVLCKMSDLNIWYVLSVSDKTKIRDEWIWQPITSDQKFNQSAPGQVQVQVRSAEFMQISWTFWII